MRARVRVRVYECECVRVGACVRMGARARVYIWIHMTFLRMCACMRSSVCGRGNIVAYTILLVCTLYTIVLNVHNMQTATVNINTK